VPRTPEASGTPLGTLGAWAALDTRPADPRLAASWSPDGRAGAERLAAVRALDAAVAAHARDSLGGGAAPAARARAYARFAHARATAAVPALAAGPADGAARALPRWLGGDPGRARRLRDSLTHEATLAALARREARLAEVRTAAVHESPRGEAPDAWCDAGREDAPAGARETPGVPRE
jgi:hypothetical protein